MALSLPGYAILAILDDVDRLHEHEAYLDDRETTIAIINSQNAVDNAESN